MKKIWKYLLALACVANIILLLHNYWGSMSSFNAIYFGSAGSALMALGAFFCILDNYPNTNPCCIRSLRTFIPVFLLFGSAVLMILDFYFYYPPPNLITAIINLVLTFVLILASLARECYCSGAHELDEVRETFF